MREEIKAYLSFSRKERLGILILLVIALGVAVTPAFIDSVYQPSDSALTDALSEQVILLEKRKLAYERKREFPRDQSDQSGSVYRSAASAPKLFEFDPNTLSTEGWMKLGVQEKTAKTIGKYLAKGGKFRVPEDLLKIYGLPDAMKQRLLPYVRIGTSSASPDAAADTSKGVLNASNAHADAPAGGNVSPPGYGRLSTPADGSATRSQRMSADSPNYHRSSYKNNDSYGGYKRKSPHQFDINRGDSLDWTSLPGIGPVLSRRIILFRQKLGGFYSVQQVKEVYGLPDSTFLRIEPYLTCVPVTTKIDINRATLLEMEQHPYFRRPVARNIIDYRNQHGPFRSLSEVLKIVTIDEETLARLSPYLSL